LKKIIQEVDKASDDNWVSTDNYMKYLKESSQEKISDVITKIICKILEERVKEYWKHIESILSKEA